MKRSSSNTDPVEQFEILAQRDDEEQRYRSQAVLYFEEAQKLGDEVESLEKLHESASHNIRLGTLACFGVIDIRSIREAFKIHLAPNKIEEFKFKGQYSFMLAEAIKIVNKAYLHSD